MCLIPFFGYSSRTPERNRNIVTNRNSGRIPVDHLALAGVATSNAVTGKGSTDALAGVGLLDDRHDCLCLEGDDAGLVLGLLLDCHLGGDAGGRVDLRMLGLPVRRLVELKTAYRCAVYVRLTSLEVDR